MEPILSRPDPPDALAVWSLPPGQRIRLRAQHLVLTIFLLVPMTLTASLGSISFSSPDGTAVVSFWPAAAFQIVFSIWFGVYGAVAGIIGPMVGNSLVGDSPFLFIPANAIQCCVAGLWFRYRKLDPRLRSGRDWFGLIVVGCVLGNALGGIVGVTESYLRSFASGGPSDGLLFWVGKLLTWFGGNTVPCLFLTPALLRTASPVVVRGSLFCRRFWGGADVLPGHRLRFRFSDLPMMGKLMLLTLVVGILPLSVVATWSVWGTMKQWEYLAAETNREAAREIRNEIERHELMLRLWGAELDRPDLQEKERKRLLQEWQSAPEAFEQLEIAELARVEAEMSPEVLRASEDLSVVFYKVGDGGERHESDLRGAIRLRSAPDKVLTGLVAWRGDRPITGQGAGAEAVLVFDQEGNELYRHAVAELANWRPEKPRPNDEAYTVRYGGRTRHVTGTVLARLGWRFVAVSSARTGQAVSLANIPNPVAVLINLAIFGSLIGGSAIAGRISRRVLAMAELVRETGAEPGGLQLPVHGQDELGYLAQTLNRVSEELAVSVRQLEETTAERERLGAEMELARQVQRSILPAEPPQIRGYEFAAASRPAREVGGDFFDFFVRADGRVVMMIGDAVGKGLRAAMFITEAHALAHAAALDRPTPEAILSAVNASMVSARAPSGNFVTMLCAVLDPQQHALLYASAGHNSPILLHDGRTQSLELGDLPLAISRKVDYPLDQVELAPGDTLILYTDGVTEATDMDKNLFGIERLEAVARRHAGRSSAEVVDAVIKAVREFAARAPQSDDITLLVLRRSMSSSHA